MLLSLLRKLVLGSILVLQSLPAAEGKRNVLFIAVDDLKPILGCYGDPHVKTPNIDRLAKRGVIFQRAYCQQAVCGPSRASLLTGARPDTTKVWDLETHFRKALPDLVTLPQHFKNNGYYALALGKILHGGQVDEISYSTPETRPANSGLTYFLPENIAIVQERQKAPAKPGGKLRPYGPAFECADEPEEKYGDAQLAKMAIQALRNLAHKEEPFWLGVGFIRPHLPFVSPKKYWDMYDPMQLPLASNPQRSEGAPDYAIPSSSELGTYANVPKEPVPESYARQLKHGYYAAVSFMDAQVGKVLDELDRLKLTEKTIIVLWGDHGWKLGEHGAWCKHTNLEEDTRVPLIISTPCSSTAGKSTESLAELVDIYPTLAELCGLEFPPHLEGASLVPVLEDVKQQVKQAAFSQYPRVIKKGKASIKLIGYSVRTDTHRLTRWVHEADHSQVESVELYDHRTDAQENRNMANESSQQETLKRLTEQALANMPVTTKTAKTDKKASAQEGRSLVKTPPPTQPPLTPVDIQQLPAGTDHVDLYLLIGQSNMKGRGFMPKEAANDPRIAMMHLKTDSWYVARHPLHLAGNPETFAKADNAGVGPGLSFAQELATADPQARIGLIPCAVGGTEIARWKKGADLYEQALRRAKLALQQMHGVKARLRGAIWLQGESDLVPSRQKVYQQELHAMIDALRVDLSLPELPFVCSTILQLNHLDTLPQKQAINTILLDLPKHRPHTAVVDARDVITHIGDNVHFDTAAQEEIGRRFAKQMLMLLK